MAPTRAPAGRVAHPAAPRRRRAAGIGARGFVALLVALATAGPAWPLEPATVQLKWRHHFQFAGYYQALAQGFYREAGLDVTIREGGPEMQVEDEVDSGRADFGVGTSALLLERAHGRDLVALAEIFQHSAAVIVTPRSTGIDSVAELAGRRVLYSNEHGDILALLKRNGLDPSRIVSIPHEGDARELLDGRADAMVAYGFNEPYELERAGVPYRSFSPLSAGIDFYGDNLFCTARLAAARPGFVAAFREATLRGWRYAFEHKGETADLILAQYSRARSRAWLLYEASGMEPLIQPELVELGYQNPARWRRIGEVFEELGMLPPGFDAAAVIDRPPRRPDLGPIAATAAASVTLIAILTGVALSFRGINRRLQAEVAERRVTTGALAESEARLRTTMDAMPVAVATLAGERVEYVNGTFVRSFGYRLEEISTLDAWFRAAVPDPARRDAVRGAWTAALAAARRGEGPVPLMDAVVTCRDGSIRHTIMATEILEARELVIFADVTERERLQAELLKLQKLDSLGVLAGGIAHDFNNLLTAVEGNVSLARALVPADSEVAEILAEAGQATRRAADLAGQLLTFARGSAPIKRPVQVRRVIDAAAALVLRGSNATCRIDLPEALPDVDADEGQIGQVFTNILLNAVQAMPGGGSIAVTAAEEQAAAGGPLALAPGAYVRVAVADSGPGIPEDHLRRVFDPYFTTKPRGNGLGLASVHSIVRKHGGAIVASSPPGAGARFEIWLPASHRRSPAPPADEAPSLRADASGRAVLVMDDEPAIRDLARRLLSRLGYHVATCAGGEEAVSLYREAHREGRPFAAAIMDLTIPGGVGGAEAAKEILRLDPDARLVVSSGYSTDPAMAEPARYGFRERIAKPYQVGEVAEVLRRVLA